MLRDTTSRRRLPTLRHASRTRTPGRLNACRTRLPRVLTHRASTQRMRGSHAMQLRQAVLEFRRHGLVWGEVAIQSRRVSGSLSLQNVLHPELARRGQEQGAVDACATGAGDLTRAAYERGDADREGKTALPPAFHSQGAVGHALKVDSISRRGASKLSMTHSGTRCAPETSSMTR